MKKYSETIAYLKEHSSIPHTRYFEFNEDENEFFGDLYKFYQGNLERQYRHHFFKIYPAYFYFIDSPDIIALSTPPKEGLFLLGISRGLIERFDTKLNRHFDVANYLQIEAISNVQSCMQNPIGEILSQSLIHFTFYHELGHLIEFSQNSRKTEKDEKLTGGEEDFDYNDHLNEADADLFASICLGAHLYQYFEKYFICEWTEKLINSYISILSSSIFTYFLRSKRISYRVIL